MLNAETMRRWREHPESFIEEALVDPKTQKLFVLLACELAFMHYAFSTDEDGNLRFSEGTYSCPRKSGKTTFAACLALVVLLLCAGTFPEVLIVANSVEQATKGVFQRIV